MATVNYSVPDNVKIAFNKTFAHENKSRIISALMLKAIEEEMKKQQRVQALSKLLKIRSKLPPVSAAELRQARAWGRP